MEVYGQSVHATNVALGGVHMAAGNLSVRRFHIRRARIAAYLTVLLASLLVLSPIAIAAQTPEAPPEVPVPVENPLPEEPPVNDPDPNPEIPNPTDPELPSTGEPDPEDSPIDESDPTSPADPDPGDSGAGGDDSEGADPEVGDESSENELDPGADADDTDGSSDQIPGEDDAVATPTEEPEPTEAPVPVVSWIQPDPVRCELIAGNTAGLAFNDSSIYRCLAAVNVSSDTDMPADMQIQWQVDLDFSDAYFLSLPEGSLAEIVSQTAGDTATSTQIVIAHPWQVDSAMQVVKFDVTLTRTTCVVGGSSCAGIA